MFCSILSSYKYKKIPSTNSTKYSLSTFNVTTTKNRTAHTLKILEFENLDSLVLKLNLSKFI